MSTRQSPWRWVLVALGVLLAIPALLGAAGAAYQALRTVADARAYPPPGRLVRVGDHDMHLYCTGERRPDRPVVILEASHPTTSSSWAWVQPRVAEATRVCSYDRAGAGWSDPAPGPRTMGRAAEELHALLAAAEEPGPYVLVGHSWGGGITRLYAARYPEDVSGLVWVEATHPDAWRRRGLAESTFGGMSPMMIRALPAVARLGLLRVFPALWGGWGAIPGLPERQAREFQAFLHASQFADYVVAVEDAVPESLEELRATGPLGDVPLAVVVGTASGEADAVGAALQEELAGLSTAGEPVRIEGADHSGLVHEQVYAEQVADVVLRMVDGAR